MSIVPVLPYLGKAQQQSFPILKRLSLLFTCILLTGSWAMAQIPEGESYNRIGLTYVNYSFPAEKYRDVLHSAFMTLPVEDKYDNNLLDSRATAEVQRSLRSNLPVDQGIKNTKVPNQIIDIMFDAKEGAWSMEKLFKRSAYNLSAAEAVRVKNSFGGLSTGVQKAEWVEPLMKSTYILAFNFSNVKDYNQYYDEVDAANRERAKKDTAYTFQPIKRTMTGYLATFKAFLYQVDLNEEVMYKVFAECWADGNSNEEAMQAALKARSDMVYPLKLVYTTDSESLSGAATKTTYRGTKQALMNRLVRSAYGKAFKQIEKEVVAFQVKADLFAADTKGLSNKIQAKIGKKEGLKVEDRYYAYENVLKANGNTTRRRVGVLRAYKVVDNRQAATGTGDMQASTFIQTQGKKMGLGVELQQKPDNGVYLTGGWGDMHLDIRAEFLLSKIAHSGRGLSLYLQLNARGYKGMFVDGAEDITVIDSRLPGIDEEYEVIQDFENTGASALHFGVGLAKEINIGTNFMLQPYAGIRLGGITFGDTAVSELVGSDGGTVFEIRNPDNGDIEQIQAQYTENGGVSMDLGIRAGLGLGAGVQLVGGLGLTPLKNAHNRDDNSIFSEQVRTTDGRTITNPFHIGVGALYWNLGLRINI
jgi:hypothetical protein